MITEFAADDQCVATTSGVVAVTNLQAQIDGLAARLAGGRFGRGKTVADCVVLIDLLLLRGHVLGRIADYERAAELADALVRAAPDDGAARLARAMTLASFHRFPEALADLDAAQRCGADPAVLDSERAANLAAMGCHSGALVLRRRSAEHRRDFATLGALAVLEGERGNTTEAERLFTEARTRYRGVSPFPVASLDYRRGLMWLGEGDPAARAWFDAAITRVPAYAPAIGHRAEVDAALGDQGRAIDRLRPLAVSSDDPEYAATLARALGEAGHAREAERWRLSAAARYEQLVSGGLRRSRGRLLAHRWRRPDQGTRPGRAPSREPVDPPTGPARPRHRDRLTTRTSTPGIGRLRAMDDSYDLVVIGAGPAGEVAAELAAAFGRTVLIVERNEPGGVVTTTGGAPTKALREAALYLTGYREAEVYDVRAAAPLDMVMPTLRARIERVRDVLQDAVADRFAARGIAYLKGAAGLGADGTVHLTPPDGPARQVAARAILVATGSRPTHYAGIPLDDPDVYDSDEIYSLDTAPNDIVIVGGGPIGVEFVSVFTALGIPATLVSTSDRLLPDIDGEVAGLVADEFQRRGVRLLLGAGAEGVKRVDRRLDVTLSNGTVLDADAVLVAARRTPNTEGLGLEQAGVRLDARGRIVVDAYHRTTAPGIYAAGDVVRPGLASNAMQQGRAAAAHACGLVFGVEIDQVASSAVYGIPEVASAGATEEQVRTADIPYAVGRCDLATTARGAIAGHGGLLKLIFRVDNRKLLGVHCFGDIASEVVGLGHAVLQLGGRVELFLTLALNTPTYSYAYHDATVDGLTRLTKLMGITDSARPQ